MTKTALEEQLEKLITKYEQKFLVETKAPRSMEFIQIVLLGQIWKELKK